MPDQAGVAVTRAAEDAEALAAALEVAGLRAVRTPLLHFLPLDRAALVERLRGAARYSWLACTSRHAASALAEAMASGGVRAEALPVRRIAAVGQGTARVLEGAGLHVDLVPDAADAEHLAHALLAEPTAHDALPPRLLFPRAVEAREVLPAMLRAAGWQVDDVPCYETRPYAAGGRALDEALARGEVEAVTLASGSAARAFATLVSPVRHASARLVSIGPTTTAAARAAGLAVAAEAPSATMEALALATRRLLLDSLSHA